MKFKIIEQTRLSTGQLMVIEQQGRKYNFCLHSTQWGVPPDSLYNLSKAEAYEAYNIHLQADVCES